MRRRELSTTERLAAQRIAVGEGERSRILRDVDSGEPIARMTVWEANEFLAWAEAGRSDTKAGGK